MIKIKYAGQVIEHETFVFSGGEVQIKLGDTSVVDLYKNLSHFIDFTIFAHITNSNEIMELFLVVDALRRKYGNLTRFYLQLPYVPYARQDRAMTSNESLALKVFADLLNSLKLDKIKVFDVHSDVALALINNVSNVPPEEFFTKQFLKDNILVSPDAGSLKKVSKIAQKFGCPMIRADKTRSVIDGSITGTVVYSENVGDKDFLIVDDICDGGRTFIELAKELRKLTTGKIKLYVTHGIFSKGLDPVLKEIDHIYCAFAFPNVDTSNPNLTVLGKIW